MLQNTYDCTLLPLSDSNIYGPILQQHDYNETDTKMKKTCSKYELKIHCHNITITICISGLTVGRTTYYGTAFSCEFPCYFYTYTYMLP